MGSRRLLLLGLVLIAVTVATAVIAVLDLRAAAIANYRDNMRNLGVVLAEELSRSLLSVDLVLDEARQHALRSGADTPQAFAEIMASRRTHDYLVDRVRHLPQAAALSVHSAEGKLINFSRTWPIPAIDATDRDYFLNARDSAQDPLLIAAPHRNRVNGNWTLYASHRVAGPDGRFLGLVQGVLE